MSSESETPQVEAISFKAEVRQLLNILAHSLYTEREIFLRELISNASDALHRVQFEMLTNQNVRDAAAELTITIDVDEEAKTIAIRDTGIGMTADEAASNLGTIARSGARAFLDAAKEQGRSGSDIIGQFGVGFYSVFMVADRVVVDSLAYHPDATPIRWESSGGDTYQLTTGERTERGTTITLHLKEDAHEFASAWRLENVIRKHSNFVNFPIMLNERRLNEQKSLWRRPARDVPAEDYTAFYRQLTLDSDEPLHTIHLSTDAPLDLHAVLYIPARRERGIIQRRTDGVIKLYSRNVLIQEETKDLLPTYFRFLEGVVDSEDLPLNVARETVQGNRVTQQLRKTLTRRVFREIETLREKEPEKFKTFFEQFGVYLKEGVATEFADRDDLLKLLRFPTSNDPQGLVSLAEYKERMIEGQTEIYYLLANDLEAAQRSPHLDAFAARGIEVLLFVELMDSFMLSGLRDYDGTPLRNIDDANLELPGEPQDTTASLIDDDVFATLSERVKAVLGERVSDVQASAVLRNNPARLVATEDAAGREMQRIQQLLGQETTQPTRRLELNRGHDLIAGLAARFAAQPDDPVATAVVEQLYDNALLLEGVHPGPTGMVPRIQQLMAAAVRQSNSD